MTDYTDHNIRRIIRQSVEEALKHAPRISDDKISEAAAAAARTAVHEYSTHFFALLGYNIANQKDIEKLRANLDFIQMVRVTSSSAASAIVKALAVALVLGALGWMVLGAKVSISHGPPPAVK